MSNEKAIEQIVLRYLAGLEQADCVALLNLFSDQALVNSPLFGELFARDFFVKALPTGISAKIQEYEIFQNTSNPSRFSLRFLVCWKLAGVEFPAIRCVDTFEIDDNLHIKELEIVFDTHLLRTTQMQHAAGQG